MGNSAPQETLESYGGGHYALKGDVGGCYAPKGAAGGVRVFFAHRLKYGG